VLKPALSGTVCPATGSYLSWVTAPMYRLLVTKVKGGT
jgi:hypothetical protein